MPIHPNEWEGFKVPSVTENDYGVAFPKGTPQLVIELQAFRNAWRHKKGWIDKRSGRFEEPFMHALRICQMLWEPKYVEIQNGEALNTYFLDCLKDLCEFDDLAITGPASAAKTFSSAVFMLICFYSNPEQFMGLISTTSGQGADRRVWGDIRKLHINARLEEYGVPKIGEIVNHKNCIVYNPAKMVGEDFNIRDFRQGIIVIPVASDSTGQAALDTIMGSKNKFVCWMVDEGPAMPTEIMSPRSNLESNPNFQFIMVGNANLRTDPLGRACEPLDGWRMIDPSVKRWRGQTLNVLFLHGECSPNDYYAPDAKHKRDLPFPYLANAITRDKTAQTQGKGNLENGRNTIHYWRFVIGYWLGSDTHQTVLSEAFVKSNGGDLEPKRWGVMRPTVFAGFDPAYTSGGDAVSLFFAEIGTDISGKKQLVYDKSAIEIRPVVSDRKEFAKAVAQEVVSLCRERGCLPQNFGGDVSGDGGIIMKAVENEWGLAGIQLLSSLEPSTRAKYNNRVSQYWMQVREIIETGLCRSFNIHGNYARDLFERRFQEDQRTFKVEKKKDMKKRIHRSPDNGDAFCYCNEMIVRSGLLEEDFEQEQKEEPSEDDIIERLFNRYSPSRRNSVNEEDDYFDSPIVLDD